MTLSPKTIDTFDCSTPSGRGSPKFLDRLQLLVAVAAHFAALAGDAARRRASPPEEPWRSFRRRRRRPARRAARCGGSWRACRTASARRAGGSPRPSGPRAAGNSAAARRPSRRRRQRAHGRRACSPSGIRLTSEIALSLAPNQRCSGRNFGSTSRLELASLAAGRGRVSMRPSRAVSVMNSGRISGIGSCQRRRPVLVGEQEPEEAVGRQRQQIGQVADRREGRAAGELDRHGAAEARQGRVRPPAPSATGWRRTGSVSSSNSRT